MDGQMITADGIALRTRVTEPAGPPRACVVLVHGIGDQVDGVPYTTAAAALAARGCAVHRLELRGHGKSGGARVYVDSFADFRHDLRQFVTLAEDAAPALPVFLVDISLGGLIVTHYALHHPDELRGVVAAAPALGETGGSRLLLALLPVMARLVPRLRLDPGLDVARLTRDGAMHKAYVEDDPLYQRKVTPRIAAEIMATIAEVRQRAPELRVPLLVLHGTGDTVTSPAASAEFVRRAGSADKTHTTYEGAYHNLFVETNREEIFDDIAEWIGARSSRVRVT